jgi:hypothetical protein
MSSEADKIYVDAGQPAVLLDGHKSMNCRTLQEAIIAWHRLPASRKSGATINVNGRFYTAAEIDRMHYAPKPVTKT